MTTDDFRRALYVHHSDQDEQDLPELAKSKCVIGDGKPGEKHQAPRTKAIGQLFAGKDKVLADNVRAVLFARQR